MPKIAIELTDTELDDLLTALCEWSPDNPQYIKHDADDIPDAEGISPRQDRINRTLYQKFGQFLPDDGLSPPHELVDPAHPLETAELVWVTPLSFCEADAFLKRETIELVTPPVIEPLPEESLDALCTPDKGRGANYRVTLTARVYEVAEIEVEANSEEEAIDIAHERRHLAEWDDTGCFDIVDSDVEKL